MTQILNGFTGERYMVLSSTVLETAQTDPFTKDLHLYSLGYFPKAKNHQVERINGCGEYILIYCTNGEGWVTVNDQEYALHSYEFITIPIHTQHSYRTSKNKPWSIYWFHFRGEKAEAFYNEMQGVCTIPSGEDSRIEERINLFDEIYAALQTDHSTEVIRYVNLCFQYLLGTFLCIDIYQDVRKRSTPPVKNAIIGKATHYMNEHIEKKLQLKEIASHFGYSESHFHRLFQKEMNESPINYFLKLKIERACYYLSYSDMKSTQIAMKLGFDDPDYFSRLFKKIKGVSPTKYKAQ